MRCWWLWFGKNKLCNYTYTAKTDRKAMFVADPFMIKVNSIWYLFYEVYDFVKAKGIIGVSYKKILKI